MRRRLRHQILLLVGLAGVGIALVSTQVFEQDNAGLRGLDIEGARRTLTYQHGADADWVRFPIPPGTGAIRIISNAIFDAEQIEGLPRPLQARYELEYRLDAGENESGNTLFETATLQPGRPRVVSPLPGRTAAPAQTIQLELTNLNARVISLRLARQDPAIVDVRLRVNAFDPVQDREAAIRWQRLTREQQARVFRGSLYPPELARPAERRAVTRARWVPLGPEGVQNADYEVAILYLVSDTEDDEDAEESSFVAPAGLPIGPGAWGVVPVPPAPTKLRLVLQPDLSRGLPPAIGALAAVQWIPQGLGSTRSWHLTTAGASLVFEKTLNGGTLVVVSPEPLILTAEVVAADGGTTDITPIPPVAIGWLTGSTDIAWRISHGPEPTPVRIDLRRTAERSSETVPPESAVLTVLDGDGKTLMTETIEVPWRPAPFQRDLDENLMTGSPVRRYFALPLAAREIRVSGQGIAASAYVRPASLPYLTRVPIDYFSFPVDPPSPSLWYGLDPEQTDALIRARLRLPIAVLPNPQESDPDILAGEYEFETLEPSGLGLGRELLLPREGAGPVRSAARSVWYQPLPRGQTTMEFEGARPGDPISPEVIWYADTADPGRLALVIDGNEVGEPLTGRQGSIRLPSIPPGRHEVRVDAPKGVDLLINFAGRRADSVNRLRRFALRVREGQTLSFDVEKQLDEESVTLALYQPPTRQRPALVRARIERPAPPPLIMDAWTPTHRLFEIRPTPGEGHALVLGSDAEVDASHAFFVTLGDDLPAGNYRVAIQLEDIDPGYISAYRIRGGRAEQSRFSLESIDESSEQELYE